MARNMCNRWAHFWAERNAPDAAIKQTFASLEKHYAEPHRVYHTLDHIEYCLNLLEEVESILTPDAVWVALWYHDAIYDTRAKDNEEKSADLALRDLIELRYAPDGFLEQVHELILATKHDAEPKSHLAKLMVDIDLSILGTSPEVFNAYDEAIHKEYAWVPGDLYRQARLEILESFYLRDELFHLPFFQRWYQPAARKNLERAIEALQATAL